jgi:NitT/TauT family transport system ATP-binding protein
VGEIEKENEMTQTMSALDGEQPGTAATPVLVVRGLRKSYAARGAEHLVLADVDLEVDRGELVCVVGPSGAGKTTLLRCMAGLLAPTAGEVRVAGRVIERTPPEVAVVFQDYSRSLMPWMSVAHNVELPLRSQGMSAQRRRDKVASALASVGLEQAAAKYPWQLSGGMQQRVAIARGLAYEPSVLLMDEPFASVDAQTRADLEDLVRNVRAEFGMTVVLVTHDIDEAVYLGDRVVVLSGSPTTVRERVDIDLGAHRDQIETKSLPRFVELRTQVLRLIRAS